MLKKIRIVTIRSAEAAEAPRCYAGS